MRYGDVQMTTRQQALRTAGVICGGLLAFNTAFWFLADLYFDDHRLDHNSFDAAGLSRVRVAFLVLTIVVAAMSFVAALAPRWIGHGLASVLGLAAMIGSVDAFAHDMPAVMGMTLLVAGIVMPLLVWRSWQHSRS